MAFSSPRRWKRNKNVMISLFDGILFGRHIAMSFLLTFVLVFFTFYLTSCTICRKYSCQNIQELRKKKYFQISFIEMTFIEKHIFNAHTCHPIDDILVGFCLITLNRFNGFLILRLLILLLFFMFFFFSREIN